MSEPKKYKVGRFTISVADDMVPILDKIEKSKNIK